MIRKGLSLLQTMSEWSCQNVCEALLFLLNNTYIRFGTKLYIQIIGIPMGTSCAPRVADLFYYYKGIT